MNPKSFQADSPGKVIRIGPPGEEHAFIPDPLPPKWTWPQSLWPKLLDAVEAIANLNGVGKYLPNPRLLLTPIENREAQKSSTIEGTYAKPKQLLLFEAESEHPKPEQESEGMAAAREVNNYAAAIRLGREMQSTLPLSLRLIRKLHERLLLGVRGQSKSPGEFRRTQVQIGRPARFVPPPARIVQECLDDFEKALHAKPPFHSLVWAFVIHYQFEAIHPFQDGNGRVGRLLLSLMIADACNLSELWLHMSAFFEKRKDEYMDRLLEVSTKTAWEPWIQFCLDGAKEQASDTEKRCTRFVELQAKYRERIAGSGSGRLRSIVDDLFVSPAVNATSLARKYNVTPPTAAADIKRLKEKRILKYLMTSKNTKHYFAPEIVDVVYRD